VSVLDSVDNRMSSLNLVVKIHPVVLFQIVDAYERRNQDAPRVIGTLLGSVEKGSVEVTNCFCVPHKEYEEKVEAELNFAREMFELNKKVNANEVVVGWWATGIEVTSHSALIHEYYARECSNPIHLTVDTLLTNGRVAIKAYVCVPIGVPKGTTGSMFSPVPVEIIGYEPELAGVKLCQKTLVIPKTEMLSDLAQVGESTRKISDLVDLVLAHVEGVLSDSIPADNTIGRTLLDLVHSVPKLNPHDLEEMMNSNMKDLLMVIYLSQLTKTQLQLNEKLSLVTM